jgi:hypothetical protein
MGQIALDIILHHLSAVALEHATGAVPTALLLNLTHKAQIVPIIQNLSADVLGHVMDAVPIKTRLNLTLKAQIAPIIRTKNKLIF